MRILIAPDKFRGSLTAPEAARAVAAGVRHADPSVQVQEIPLADGGEGTLEALVLATSGTFHRLTVSGPWGEPVVARFGMLGDGTTAVIEMAEASGLKLVPPGRRDPSRTTTRGTGELLQAAIAHGARQIVIGIGGSATNDGGAGLAQALGVRLLDAGGEDLPPGGGMLDRLDRIEAEPTGVFQNIAVVVACDVENKLCGPDGASAVFGPQKGADPAMVARLDRNLDHLADVIHRDLRTNIRDIPGGGAAGGLGAGLIAFAGGRLQSGIGLILDLLRFEERLLDADLVLTGEGTIDGSSASGKTVAGVGRLARKHGVPAFALAGAIGPGAEAIHDQGIDAIFSLCPGPVTLETALTHAAPLAERAGCQMIRAFLAGRRSRVAHERI